MAAVVATMPMGRQTDTGNEINKISTKVKTRYDLKK